MSRLAYRGLRKASALASFRGHREIPEADPGSRTRKTKIMGRKEEKKKRCEGRGRWVVGWVRRRGRRKVRPEKRRRVNGGGLRAPGSRAMEPRRFIGVARDGERRRKRGS